MPRTITLRNVPEDMRRALKARAAAHGKSLSAYLLERFVEIAEQPSVEEWRAEIRTHEPMNLKEESVKILRATRDAS